MSDSLRALKSELHSLFQERVFALAEIGSLRVMTERVDRYSSLIREVLCCSSLCYVGERMMYFDGRVYVETSVKQLSVIISNLLSPLGVGASDLRKVGDMPYSVIWERHFQIDHNRISFSNCSYDIVSGKSEKFSSSFITDYWLPYAFHKRAVCPLWDAFLSEVLPDESERLCLQEFFGMCYIDRDKMSLEKFAIFMGGGSNGKSVVFDVIKNVIGRDRVSYLSPEQLIDGRQVVSVIGKRLNFAPDIRKAASFDSALKALSSGQDVQGWMLYAGNVVVKCPPLVFALNELPRFRDVTSAFFRRMMLFSFDVTIPPERQNKTLASDIVQKELPGVFLWIMEGRARLMRNRGAFTPCPKMESNIEAFKRRIRSEEAPVLDYLDSVGLSIRPCYSGQPFVKVAASHIYEGLEGKISRDAITRELTSYGVRRDRGKEVRYFLYKNKI